MAMSIRKNDQVVIRAGKDRGKKGRVLSVVPGRNRVIVEGVNLIKRHTRPNPQKNIKGGIVEREASIHASNVMLLDPETNEPTRVGKKVLADGSRVRIGRKSGTVVDK
jgi:large subunit ribosomal protein L24